MAVGSAILSGLNLAGFPWPAYARPLPGLPGAWAAPVFVLLVVGPVLVAAEARVHPAGYQAWRRRQLGLGVRDLLCLRDIPDPRPGSVGAGGA